MPLVLIDVTAVEGRWQGGGSGEHAFVEPATVGLLHGCGVAQL